MATKRKFSNVQKKGMKSPEISNECGSWFHGGWIKLVIIALVLFLLTLWPWLKEVAMKVYWAWYLAVAIIFYTIHYSIHRKCRCGI